MINNKRVLVIITARAGSKGIKDKNIKELYGKPLFEWSVEALRGCKYVDDLVISSNCPIIKKEWEKDKYCFTDFIQRPEEISGDLSKNEEALLHVLEVIDIPYDIIVNLQPTSPIRKGQLLTKCLEKYVEGYDSLLTGKKMTPFFWQKRKDKWEYKNGNPCNRKMRQEINDDEFLFHDCGSVYITDSIVLKENGCRVGKNPYIYEVDKYNALQIDSEFDFKLIENIAKTMEWNSLV